MVRCEREAAGGLPRSGVRVQRFDERRRAAAAPLELDRIVIEADPLRRSVEDAMAGALPARPAHGTHTFTTAEGSQCSCMNRCPPLPFPCCQCSAHMSRYSVSPGASPLR